MIGTTVGQYRIVEVLGAGGMGVVYRAEDTKLGRQAALKFLPESMVADSRALERFRREARAASSLNHPNICTIYDIGEHDGRPYIAMELLEGQTLWQRLQAGPLPLDEWVRIGIQVGEALDVAHAAGMIHRDIKPANLFLTSRGQAKVLDFGLAKQREDDGVSPGTAMPTASAGGQPLTREGATIGTIAYMSPEQARGEQLDGRSDLFSLGAVLYEMATGRAAFKGNTSAVVFDAILRGAPAPAAHSRPDAPPEMLRIIDKTLEKDRRVRYQTAAELVADLRRLRRDTEASQAGLTPAAGVTPAGGMTARGDRRPGLTGLAIGGILLLMLAALAVSAWFVRGRSAPTASTPATGGAGTVTIAVLPFEDFGAGEDQRYLALAVPDEIATTLSHASTLAVRPFAMSRSIESAGTDPAAAARALGVGHLVTGHFAREGDVLRISLETIAAADNRVVWKDGLSVAPGNMIALRESLADMVENGLLPALGVHPTGGAGTRPGSEEAYDLYLRSLAFGSTSEPTAQAVDMLRRAVDIDPGYAPAWVALARRYYEQAQYQSDDPERIAERLSDASESIRRAIELDPDLLEAVRFDILMRVERGETADAYDRAREFARRNPGSSRAHFTLAYVFRYAGMLDESQRECDTALDLDPSDPGLRSCAIAFYFDGRYDRARVYFALDADSSFTYFNRVQLLMREGGVDELRDLVREGLTERDVPPLMTARCILGEPRESVAPLVDPEEELVRASRDAESYYGLATRQAWCGFADHALRNLQRAVDAGYCAYPLMDNDPLLASLRDDPRYVRAREAGRACRQAFERHLEQAGIR